MCYCICNQNSRTSPQCLCITTGYRPPLSSTRIATAGKNHVNEEITALLPRDRRAILPNRIKFRTRSDLAPMWWTYSGEALVILLLWKSECITHLHCHQKPYMDGRIGNWNVKGAQQEGLVCTYFQLQRVRTFSILFYHKAWNEDRSRKIVEASSDSFFTYFL